MDSLNILISQTLYSSLKHSNLYFSKFLIMRKGVKQIILFFCEYQTIKSFSYRTRRKKIKISIFVGIESFPANFVISRKFQKRAYCRVNLTFLLLFECLFGSVIS